MRQLYLIGLTLVLAVPLYAQRGGMPNADESFNKLLAGYGGTGDVVDYARVSPESRERFNRFAQMMGSEPMPVSGTITRADYAVAFNKRMEAMQARGGMRGGGDRGGDRGGPPQTGGAAPGAPTPGVTVTMGSPAPPPQQAERTVSDEEVAKFMRRYDRNDDGRISAEEGERTEKLRYVFSHYDSNRDGVIDMGELKVYRVDSENRRVPEPPRDGQNQNQPQQSYGQPPPQGNYYSYDQGRGGNRDSVAPIEEPKPVVYRYGKLPMKDLPSWFESLDTDKDGQIGLYEWRGGKRLTSEFVTMDLNTDGLLTAEEYLRWKKVPTVATGTTSSPSAMTTLSGKDSKESSKDGRKDERREKGEKGEKGGNNPFRRN